MIVDGDWELSEGFYSRLGWKTSESGCIGGTVGITSATGGTKDWGLSGLGLGKARVHGIDIGGRIRLAGVMDELVKARDLF